MSASSSGASRRRKVFSAMSSVFQITAVAFSTFLNRLAAAVRSRTAAKGDSTGFAVQSAADVGVAPLRTPCREPPLLVLGRLPRLGIGNLGQKTACFGLELER